MQVQLSSIGIKVTFPNLVDGKVTAEIKATLNCASTPSSSSDSGETLFYSIPRSQQYRRNTKGNDERAEAGQGIINKITDFIYPGLHERDASEPPLSSVLIFCRSVFFNGTRGRGELFLGDEKHSEKFPLNHRPKEHCTRRDRNQLSVGGECRTARLFLWGLAKMTSLFKYPVISPCSPPASKSPSSRLESGSDLYIPISLRERS